MFVHSIRYVCNRKGGERIEIIFKRKIHATFEISSELSELQNTLKLLQKVCSRIPFLTLFGGIVVKKLAVAGLMTK